MEEVQLAFKAFDIHELTAHFVARQTGLYAEHGLRVRLLDSTFIPDEQLPGRTLQVACGAALSAWLRGGVAQRVICVAAERPMFWLYGSAAVVDVEQLAGQRIAAFPPGSPPALLLRALLAAADARLPDAVEILPARDDVARRGLLCAGDADAAVFSSAMLPASLDREGLTALLAFGDQLQVATTGLAAPESLLASEPELAGRVARCYQASIRRLHHDSVALAAAVAEIAGLAGTDLEAACMHVRHHYTADGYGRPAVLRAGEQLMHAALGLGAPLPREPLYDFSLLDPTA